MINRKDQIAMESLLEMNVRLSGNYTEEEIQSRMMKKENIVFATKQVLATRLDNKLYDIAKLRDEKCDEIKIRNYAQNIISFIPDFLLGTLDEWINDMAITDNDICGTNITKLVEVFDGDDKLGLLAILESYVDFPSFEQYPDLFLLFTISRTPHYWYDQQYKDYKIRDNWCVYYNTLQRLGRDDLDENWTKKQSLALDFLNYAREKWFCRDSHYDCVRLAIDVVDCIPEKMHKNIIECVEEKPFSDIEWDGLTVNKFMKESKNKLIKLDHCEMFGQLIMLKKRKKSF